eukprot:tig00000215_g18583.t1
MLAALASAPVPLESVRLSGCWRAWPAAATQRQLGIAAPQSLEDVALDFLTALHPAPVRSLQLDDEELTSAFIVAAEQNCLPRLRELRIESLLFAEHTAKLVEVWPRLQTVSCSLEDGRALRKLAALPLEDLRLSVELNAQTSAGLERALEAANADCVRALRLSGRLSVSPRLLASILRLRNLEELSVRGGPLSGYAIAGLGSLKKLRSLNLELSVRDAPNGGAGLLRAAAAAAAELSAAPQFESFTLTVDGGGPAGPEMDPGSLAALVRASWPKLSRCG